MKKINFDELKDKVVMVKWRAKKKIKHGVSCGVKWVGEHKEELVVAIPLVTGLLGTVVKVANKFDRKAELKQEQKLKDLYVYDRSLGAYLKLKRKRKAWENIEIDRRRGEGERMVDILLDLGLLDKR